MNKREIYDKLMSAIKGCQSFDELNGIEIYIKINSKELNDNVLEGFLLSEIRIAKAFMTIAMLDFIKSECID